MRRRDLTTAFLLTAFSACAPASPPSPTASAPPPGAETAAAAFPPLGAKWRVRVTESGLFRDTVEERDIQAARATFAEQTVYGLVGPTFTTALDPASFSPVGTLTNGVATTIVWPAEGPLVWPLWAGKTWAHTYAMRDYVYGQIWPSARSTGRVAAIETVTVPAGTFRAFRIEYAAGLGTGQMSHRNMGAPVGIETAEVHWYAPAAKLVVKSIVRRASTNKQGVGVTTTELVTLPG